MSTKLWKAIPATRTPMATPGLRMISQALPTTSPVRTRASIVPTRENGTVVGIIGLGTVVAVAVASRQSYSYADGASAPPPGWFRPAAGSSGHEFDYSEQS